MGRCGSRIKRFKAIVKNFLPTYIIFFNSIPIIIWENFEFQLLGARSLNAIKHWPIYRTIRGFLGGLRL